MSLKEKAESKAKEYQVADVCRVWNGGCPNVRYASMEMFEWAKQEIIDKACEFLKSYHRDYPDGTGYVAGIVDDETIEDFKKYMEE